MTRASLSGALQRIKASTGNVNVHNTPTTVMPRANRATDVLSAVEQYLIQSGARHYMNLDSRRFAKTVVNDLIALRFIKLVHRIFDFKSHEPRLRSSIRQAAMTVRLQDAFDKISECAGNANVTIGSRTLRHAYRATEVLDAIEEFLSSNEVLHETLTRRQHAKAICKDLVDLKMLTVLYPPDSQYLRDEPDCWVGMYNRQPSDSDLQEFESHSGYSW